MEKVIQIRGINKKTVFYTLIIDTIKMVRKEIEAENVEFNKEKYNREATVAEEFSSLVIDKFYLALYLGVLRRLSLESEKNIEIKELIKKTEEKLNGLISFICLTSSSLVK